MMIALRAPLEQAWTLIREKLFHAGTGLCYDWLSGPERGAERFRYLPDPAEIAAGFPNPCGWSTGMEDCALNAGFLLDSLRARRELSTPFAGEALRGLLSLGSAHGLSGFIARGLTPVDGKSCYGNSSLDQFTLAVYGLWRVHQAGADPGGATRRQLRDTALYCERRIAPEFDYNLGRLDGGRAVVSKLWDCAPHEALRLPMIYGMAHEVTGDAHFMRLCRRYAEPGLARTLTLDTTAGWWDIPLVQMQLSLRYFAESRATAALPVDGAMRLAATLARRELSRLLDRAEAFAGDWYAYCGNWRTLPMLLTLATLSPDERMALFDGKSYLNPRYPTDFGVANGLLRGMGNYLAVMVLAGEDPGELMARMAEVLAPIDLGRVTGAGVVSLAYGLSLWLAGSDAEERRTGRRGRRLQAV